MPLRAPHSSAARAVLAACVALAAVIPARAGATSARGAGGAAPARESHRFVDATGAAGINFQHNGFGVQDKFQGTGAAWLDFDNDGDLDLYLTRRIGANYLYENQGDGTFINVAAARGCTDPDHDGAGVAAADYDNDGWTDLFLANSDEDVLYRNTGGAFTAVTAAAGFDMLDDNRGTTAAWGDYDGDGWLDLYIANHEHLQRLAGRNADKLYHNNGDGTFSNVSHLIPIENRDGYGFIGGWTDIDNDGDVDLFVVNDCPIGPKGTQVMRNDGTDGAGGWVFTDVTEEIGAAACEDGMGLAVGDYNRDGRLDYFYTNIGNPVLLRNDGDGFAFQTGQANLLIGLIPTTGRTRWTWGANFFDYDHDGWEDLYIASGSFRGVATLERQPNLLMHNNGDGTFTDVSDADAANDDDRSRTSVVGDYDGDGDLDLFVVNYEETGRLYRNEGDKGSWLIVDLEGVVSNRDGIGARVRVRTSDGALQYREVRSGSSLGGGDEVVAHFGLGNFTVATEVVVRWPSGIVQRLENVAANQRILVVEDPMAAAPLFTRFGASERDGEVTLEWETVLENGVSGFQVEHEGPDGFETRGYVNGSGWSFSPQSYAFDAGAYESGPHGFRIRAELSDGSSVDSPALSVNIAPPLFAPILRVGPNPSTGNAHATVAVVESGAVTVELFDARGRRVARLFSGFVEAGREVELGLERASLPSGVYLLRATGPALSATRKVALVR